ncbi:DNA polymerase III subunit beta [Ktedonospora formicarum]|uniref:DNA polymerase III subunit beta n=1 Tax=Ktedonospora formicarum TaxID=2778364 RepID=UPI001C68A059|nr:DNA polymerase III subunit beta [Ktedonospora formicarum]
MRWSRLVMRFHVGARFRCWQNVHVATDGELLQVSASNGEGVSIVYRLAATIEAHGSIAFPAKLLTDYIGSLQTNPVSLALQEGTYACHISCGRSSADINGTDPSQFPVMPAFDDEQEIIVLEANQLKEMIEQVSFAATQDTSRPIFTGMYLTEKHGQLTCVAADSFRLAVRNLPVAEHLIEELLIPARVMEQLARILPKEGTVEIGVTPRRNLVRFHTPSLDFFAPLLEGTYANYQAVLPKVWRTRAVME